MLKIILARHAETIWNEERRYIGRADLGLSRLGKDNSRLLASHLKNQPIIKIVSSSMKRATQTAEIVNLSHHQDILRQPLLNEINFGIWEGLTHDEIVEQHPELVKRWFKDPFSTDIPEGEPWRVFADRVWSGWLSVVNSLHEHSPQRESADEAKIVLIVTHAGCIKNILARILGREPQKAWHIYQDKGALNHLIYKDGNIKIARINDTDYRSSKKRNIPEIKTCDSANKEDLHFVISKASAAYARIFGETFDPANYMSMAELTKEMEEMSFFGIVQGGLMIAAGAYQAKADVALMRHLYVLPACQGQGMGSRLLSHIEGVAKTDGQHELLVGTYEKNREAIDFYVKQGFKISQDSQRLLKKYWDIPQRQAEISIVFSKRL